jgi:hypothetical protein
LPPPGQNWKTFLRNHAGIAAMDLLVMPTIGFRLLYAFAILDHDRRPILSVALTSHSTAEWVARQIAEALPWQETPQYLLRDRDAVYGRIVRQRLAATGIRDRPITARRHGKTDISNASSALDKDAPIHRTAHHTGTIVAIPMLGGLHHHHVRT